MPQKAGNGAKVFFFPSPWTNNLQDMENIIIIIILFFLKGLYPISVLNCLETLDEKWTPGPECPFVFGRVS